MYVGKRHSMHYKHLKSCLECSLLKAGEIINGKMYLINKEAAIFS